MHQQSHQIAQQNMLRQHMMNRHLLLQAAQQVAATPATVEDIQELVDISRTAEPQGLDFAQVVTRIRESTPFTSLIQLLLKDRGTLRAAGGAGRRPRPDLEPACRQGRSGQPRPD
jgi:hypothetical protein